MDEIIVSKKCFRCKVVTPLDGFQLRESSPDGHRGVCKRCSYKRESKRRKRCAKTISVSHKPCATCKETLPASGFWKCRSAKDGLQLQCKKCKHAGQLKYERTTKGKLARHRSNHKPGATECRRRYAKTEASKASNKRYEQSERGKSKRTNRVAKYRLDEKWKQYRRDCSQRFRVRYPEKRAAHRAVECAVYLGLIPPVAELICRHCGKNAEAYHHFSYDIQHWLDVVPLCNMCHVHEHLRLNAPG